MRDERTVLWLQKKRQNPQVQMRAVFVALILKFQSVISKEQYISTQYLFKMPKRARVDKIRQADL